MRWAESSPRFAQGEHLRQEITSIEPLNLTVVDDDADVRIALQRLLRAMGHRVRVYASAEEYEAEPCSADCLIVDLRMPGSNGFELKERIRLRGSTVPIVFITGDGGPSPGDTSVQANTPVVAKPFDDGDLMLAISQAMSGDRIPLS